MHLQLLLLRLQVEEYCLAAQGALRVFIQSIGLLFCVLREYLLVLRLWLLKWHHALDYHVLALLLVEE